MRRFVVDENVVMEAIEGKKPNEDRALSEAQFVLKLLGSGDSLFVNDAILKKYRGIEQKIEMRSRSEGLNNGIHKAFMQTLTDARVHRIDGVPVDWAGLKKCDKEFVAVALQSRSILVTADARLREIVEGHPLGSRIECATAECALELIGAQG